MKKSVVAVVLLFAVLLLTNVVFASPNSFNDVPKTHWAYQAVSQLANVGLIDGYKDGFNGERTLTRYEFAVIVAKALNHIDKADAANRVVIDKLSAEFASELNTLGARVQNLEQRMSPIKLGGILNSSYDYVKNPSWITKTSYSTYRTEKNEFRYHLLLFMDAKLDDNVKFQAVWEEQHVAGDVEVPTSPSSGGLDSACVTVTNPGVEYAVGRQQVKLNQGFLVDTPFLDGARVTVGNKILATGGLFKQGVMGTEIKFGDLQVPFGYKSSVGATDFQGTMGGSDVYKAKILGFNYREIPNITMSGEYGKNDGTSAKGWFAKIEYGGANPFVVGTSGYAIAYRYADYNFDPCGLSNAGTFGPEAVVNDNIKGVELIYERTVYKGGLLQFRYSPARSVDAAKSNGVADKTFYQIYLSTLIF
ncbi:MAG: S-layer y domain protein [Firmicutes bacterium]|nr:S-layer y domain protein [Bacillota bacterium]